MSHAEAAIGLLELENSGIPVIRGCAKGYYCVGRMNSCQNIAAINGYCITCAYCVCPNWLTVRQIFQVAGEDIIITRNGCRYIKKGATVRKLCCGDGNTCNISANRGGLCLKHSKKMTDMLSGVPKAIVTCGSVKFKLDDTLCGMLAVRVCDYPGCEKRSRGEAYCAQHASELV